MNKRIVFLGVLVVLMVTSLPVSASPRGATTIMSVVKNESVTVRLESFPAEQTFNVMMGFNGTLGINGYLVSKLTTNAGGTFLAKFPIPQGLAGEQIIAIRFESIDSNVFWYDWFYNETAASQPAVVPSSQIPSASPTKPAVRYNLLEPGFPTFTAIRVDAGDSMTLRTQYFPGRDRWAIYIKDGAMANVTWYEVGGFNAADGGYINVDINIPEAIKYKPNLAIKFYNLKTGFYTYNLIDNRDYP